MADIDGWMNKRLDKHLEKFDIEEEQEQKSEENHLIDVKEKFEEMEEIYQQLLNDRFIDDLNEEEKDTFVNNFSIRVELLYK